MTDTWEARLPSHVWIMAAVRHCHREGYPAFVVRKGERTTGLALVKVNRLDGSAAVYVQQRDLDGVLGWLPIYSEGAAEDSEVEAYIARSVKRDPDLWVIEVERADGGNPFAGREITL